MKEEDEISICSAHRAPTLERARAKPHGPKEVNDKEIDLMESPTNETKG